jgi:hypothetical protein
VIFFFGCGFFLLATFFFFAGFFLAINGVYQTGMRLTTATDRYPAARKSAKNRNRRGIKLIQSGVANPTRLANRSTCMRSGASQKAL